MTNDFVDGVRHGFFNRLRGLRPSRIAARLDGLLTDAERAARERADAREFQEARARSQAEIESECRKYGAWWP